MPEHRTACRDEKTDDGDSSYSLSAAFLHFLFRGQVAAIKHQDGFDVEAQQHVHKLHAVPHVPANGRIERKSQWSGVRCSFAIGGLLKDCWRFSLVCSFAFGQFVSAGKSSFVQPAVGVHSHRQTPVLWYVDGLWSIFDELEESRDTHPGGSLKSKTDRKHIKSYEPEERFSPAQLF